MERLAWHGAQRVGHRAGAQRLPKGVQAACSARGRAAHGARGVRRLERVLGSSRPRKSQSATPAARRRFGRENKAGRMPVAEGMAVGSEVAEGTVRFRVRVEAAPMTTGVLALKTMNVSTLQYCSVLMFVNIHARKATDTQKKLWCSAGAHE